jgi:hypothetical protein
VAPQRPANARSRTLRRASRDCDEPQSGGGPPQVTSRALHRSLRGHYGVACGPGSHRHHKVATERPSWHTDETRISPHTRAPGTSGGCSTSGHRPDAGRSCLVRCNKVAPSPDKSSDTTTVTTALRQSRRPDRALSSPGPAVCPQSSLPSRRPVVRQRGVRAHNVVSGPAAERATAASTPARSDGPGGPRRHQLSRTVNIDPAARVASSARCRHQRMLASEAPSMHHSSDGRPRICCPSWCRSRSPTSRTPTPELGIRVRTEDRVSP